MMSNGSVLHYITMLTAIVVCVFLRLSSGASVTELGNIPEDSGYKCVYEGVSYNVGDELPTHGKCWHCVCREGWTEINIFSCAAIDCPSRRWECEAVYEEGKCCPTYTNCSEPTRPSTRVITTPKVRLDRCHHCDHRYFQHYETKHCTPVYDEGCECPKGFHCSDLPAVEDATVCTYKGKTYSKGENMPTSNPCKICRCEEKFPTSTAFVDCIGVECGSMFRRPLEGCYDVYEEGRCCPTTTKCSDDSTSNSTGEVEPTCEFEGKTYHLGQHIYSNEDPCLICLCDKDFHGKNSSSCHIHDCELEQELSSLKDGCIPIYHEKTCCPIEFHCPNGFEGRKPSGPNEYIALNESDPLTHCTFNGKSFSIGDELDISHPTNCVTCTCMTPPDFTCIHRVCEPPPNNDYENCQSIYIPGQCCPKYQCTLLSAPPRMCDSVKCVGDCIEVYLPNGCPMCQCQKVLCAPPKCLPGCEINYDVAPGSCPTCKCTGVSAQVRPICAPVKCSPECFEGISSQGCPMCICSPLCSQPKCEDGCHVQTNIAEGQCPGCECPSAPDSDIDLRVRCAPVKCPPMCEEVTGNMGCPACKCDVMCSPPKCMPGCHTETPPYAGPCPGCQCGSISPDKGTANHCPSVHCAEGCTEVSVPHGCSLCQCSNILCSPPKCEEGCTEETEAPPGGCPGCKCPPTMQLDRPMCGPVKCGPQCHEGISPQGCPMCVCGPLCSPPKCGEDCKIQTDFEEGQCPGCICNDPKGDSELDRIRCSPVVCPSYCRTEIGSSGCEVCICDPMCSPPKCAPRCRVESIPSSPCPGCICDSVHDQLTTILCSPPKCKEGCIPRLVPPGPCPTCQCDEESTSSLHRILCSPPKCKEGCFPKLVPPGPCPTCQCDDSPPSLGGIMCSPPKCKPGCFPKLVPPGPCPTCQCDEESTSSLHRILCSPPKCKEGCFPKLVPPGPCPTCQCDDSSSSLGGIMCSPPKCKPGCFPKLVPPGPCPTCQCDEESTFGGMECPQMPCMLPCRSVKMSPTSCPICVCGASPHCTVPDCAPGCTTEISPITGCHECVCPETDGSSPQVDVQCSPVPCNPGCHLETNVAPGACPECVCDGRHFRSLDTIQCPNPRCDIGCFPRVVPPGRCPTCYCREGGRVGGMECPQLSCMLPCRHVKMSPTSCPMCICDNAPLCTIPECEPGCMTEVSSTTGCHECVCPDRSIRCAPVKCAPTCREVTNEYGCPACKCDVLCSPPRCRPGCPAKLDRSRGPCPACTC